MLMDFELYQAVTDKINNIVKAYYTLYKINLDMVISQTADKYENSEYEIIMYALGTSNKLGTEKYYFNALNNENSKYHELVQKFYNEPVWYYENLGTVDKYSSKPNPIIYHIEVETFRKRIKIYQVNYYNNTPRYTTVDVIDLKSSKFAKKVQHK